MSGPTLPPFPDTPSPESGSPPDEQALAPDSPSPAPPLSTASSDEIGVLLSQPTPDPYLRDGAPEPLAPGSSAFAPLEAATPGAALRPDDTLRAAAHPEPLALSEQAGSPAIRLSSRERTGPFFDTLPAAASSTADDLHGPGQPGISWPFVLVSSYASALTLALVWILWSGRGLPRPSGPADAPSPPADEAEAIVLPTDPLLPAVPLPEAKLTTLGRPARLGEIEVVPRQVSHQPVELVRLEGSSDDRRESESALRLTLEIRNLSRHDAFAPLDPALVRDPSPGADQPCLELPGGRCIPLFRLATESEWSIAGQVFPILQPGEAVETVLVSQPIPLERLAEPLIWRVKLRTSLFQTDVLGVRFSLHEIQVFHPEVMDQDHSPGP